MTAPTAGPGDNSVAGSVPMDRVDASRKAVTANGRDRSLVARALRPVASLEEDVHGRFKSSVECRSPRLNWAFSDSASSGVGPYRAVVGIRVGTAPRPWPALRSSRVRSPSGHEPRPVLAADVDSARGSPRPRRTRPRPRARRPIRRAPPRPSWPELGTRREPRRGRARRPAAASLPSRRRSRPAGAPALSEGPAI